MGQVLHGRAKTTANEVRSFVWATRDIGGVLYRRCGHAMERDFGGGRAFMLCCPSARGRGDVRSVPGVRISRKTGYKIFKRYKDHGILALTDRFRRPVRPTNCRTRSSV